MSSYHFSLGNSSTGPVGFCARITADSPEAAVARLRTMLPEDSEQLTLVQDDGYGEGEYIAVYLNGDAVTVADIDEQDDAEPQRERNLRTDLCATCRVKDHDTCSLDPACSCCATTLASTAG